MGKQKRYKARKKIRPVRLEKHVRVTFFLVAQTQEEVEAIYRVINYLAEQYGLLIHNGEWDLPVTGFTYSAFHDVGLKKDPIFIGLWWTESEIKYMGMKVPARGIMVERVALFVIDFPVEEPQLDEAIVHLKERIFFIYKECGSPQEEIWIVKQDAYRYA